MAEGRENIAPLVKMDGLIPPKPEKAVIDYESINKWLGEEKDPDFLAIKHKLLDNVNYVNFNTFQESLFTCVDKLNEMLEKSDEQYAVLWDYKPHASKRWTYLMAESRINKKPKYAGFFAPSAEKEIGTIDKLHEKGVRKFIVIDDSAYSGEQISNRTIEPIIKKYKEKYPSEKPEFIIVVPYVTDTFKGVIDYYKQRDECKIELINNQEIKKIYNILDSNDQSLISNRRNGALEKNSNEHMFMGSTLTFFDHRVADSHSFNEEMAKVMNIKYSKTYADNNSEYSKKEKADFTQYFNKWTETQK